jgi:hypothetical protein
MARSAPRPRSQDFQLAAAHGAAAGAQQPAEGVDELDDGLFHAGGLGLDDNLDPLVANLSEDLGFNPDSSPSTGHSGLINAVHAGHGQVSWGR